MKKLRFLLLAVFTLTMSLFAAGCGDTAEESSTDAPKKTVLVKHAQGETEVPINPQRVIILNFGALDTMDKLGVSDAVAAIPGNNVPPYLEKYKDAKYVDIGDLRELNYEKISALNPDLIITSSRHEEQYAELSKIAPTINMGVDYANYWESFQEKAKVMGMIFEKEDVVATELNKLQAKVDAMRTITEKAAKTGTVILTNGGKLRIFGPGSRFDFVFGLSGALPIAGTDAKAGTHGQNASFELIAQDNPAWIIVVDRDSAIGQGNAAKDLLNTPLINGTDAAKNGKIVYVDSALWYLSGGGLESMDMQLDDIAKAIE